MLRPTERIDVIDSNSDGTGFLPSLRSAHATSQEVASAYRRGGWLRPDESVDAGHSSPPQLLLL